MWEALGSQELRVALGPQAVENRALTQAWKQVAPLVDWTCPASGAVPSVGVCDRPQGRSPRLGCEDSGAACWKALGLEVRCHPAQIPPARSGSHPHR